MHCIIRSADNESFPHALRPIQGRAAIDYLIDDVLLQKDITAISILTSSKSISILSKHLKNAYPQVKITILESSCPKDAIVVDDDILYVQSVVHTSLKLQDFVRYFKQFKTVTRAAYDKLDPKEIPFIIIPKKDCQKIDTIDRELEFHTYNCGTGFCYL